MTQQTGHAIPVQLWTSGDSEVLTSTQPYTVVTVNISSATTTTIVAASAGKTVRVYKVLLVIAATQTLDIKSSGGTSLVGAPMTFTGGGSIVLDFGSSPWFTTVSAEGLTFVTTTTGGVVGAVYYIQS